jgi:hypothetical protein
VISWTESVIDNNFKLSDMKGTDQKVTNGEYHCSWFKGPYKILENGWRNKHGVNELFDELSGAPLRTSKAENIIKYLTILLKTANYKKLKKYKYEKARLKWRYKRLLGKRSYIDRMTNDLAYGKPLKKYGRARVKHKSSCDKPAIVIFGAGGFKTSMKTYSAVPRKSILRVLAQKTTVMLINEFNTTKKCFRCGDNLKEIQEKQEKIINNRIYSKWSRSDLRNVRYCENTRCIHEDHSPFYIGRDVNASNNMLLNGFKHLSATYSLCE